MLCEFSYEKNHQKKMNDNSSGGMENNSVSIRIFRPIKIIQIFIKVGKMTGTQGYK